MTHKELEDYILSFPNTWLDYPFGEGTAVYKVGHKDSGEGKMFALIDEQHKPLRISLKSDPQLSLKLRADYETVLPGFHLNKKHWNTILLTGQLSDEDVKGLITHSYHLVSGN